MVIDYKRIAEDLQKQLNACQVIAEARGQVISHLTSYIEKESLSFLTLSEKQERERLRKLIWPGT